MAHSFCFSIYVSQMLHHITRPRLRLFQINGKDMKIARHEDAVGMLTGGLSYVTLVVVREKVINKRMLPLSKLQDQSPINKRTGVKVGSPRRTLEGIDERQQEVGRLVENYITSKSIHLKSIPSSAYRSLQVKPVGESLFISIRIYVEKASW